MGSAKYVWELSRLALGDNDGLVAVQRIYMDESGTHDGSPVVTVAAYIGRPKAWKAFTKEWNREKKPIKVFHSVDCASLRNEFEGWGEQQRNEYCANLLPVLARNQIYGLSMSFPLPELERELSAHSGAKETFGNPYVACFRITARMIVCFLEYLGSNERLAFIHEDNDYTGEAEDAFNFVKKTRDRHYGPMSLTFGGKSDYVPLQAADVLAYESNKRVRNPKAPWRRSFKAINPDGERCDVLYVAPEKLKNIVPQILVAQDKAGLIGLEEFSFYGKVPKFFGPKAP